MLKPIVDNTQYFRAVESEVRSYMKKFETDLLMVAEQAVKDAGFEVTEYPKEGYYNETVELGRYFDCLRTLQENFSDKVTPSIRKLHDVYTHPIFGLKQGVPTAINPTDVMYPDVPQATISPVADPVTIASEKTGPDWTINKIMHAIERDNLGVCLISLAIKVDEKDNKKNDSYNPLATCIVCEATILSRMKFGYKCAPSQFEVDWQVTSDIESYGNKVIEGYSNLMTTYGSPSLEMPLVTPRNVSLLLDDAPEMERCVNLNIIDIPPRPKEFYHWAIRRKNEGYRVVDFFSPKIITTQEFLVNPSAIDRYINK